MGLSLNKDRLDVDEGQQCCLVPAAAASARAGGVCSESAMAQGLGVATLRIEESQKLGDGDSTPAQHQEAISH